MTRKDLILACLLLLLMMPVCVPLWAVEEPSRPDVDADLTNAEETKIEALKSLDVNGAIGEITKDAFMIDENSLDTEIYFGFAGRSREAVDRALNLLKNPRLQIVGNNRIDRTEEFFVARKILQVFPEESMPEISAIYEASDTSIKNNLIEALGNMAGGQARSILISALDDKTPLEQEEFEEGGGEPLRICDAAYNQLVLRYQVADVLRTIGSAHTLEQRDYHISVLRQKI